MRTLSFNLLGPLEVRQGDAVVQIAGPCQQALLARLLLSAGMPVSTDRLVADLGVPPRQSRARGAQHSRDVLHTRVLRLRRALEEGLDGWGRDLLVRTAQGYALRVARDAVDVHVFRKQLSRAREAADGGEVEQAVEAYRRAERLWRGPALAEFADLAFAVLEAGELEELRVAALEERFELELTLGRAARLVAELAQATERNPLRERLCGQLMLALYLAGRQAEALGAYQRLRHRLAEELGVSPSRALQRLEHEVLTQSASLAPVRACALGRRSGQARERELAALPPPLEARAGDAPFVGRERELAQLLAAWNEVVAGARRVAVVAGEPGIGKTRLAAELARAAAADRALVLYGRCDDALPLPHHPFVEALSDLPPSVAGTPSSDDVVKLLRDQPAAVPPAAVFAAVAAALQANRDVPVLVVLDDVHWADPSSLLLLRYLVLSARLPRTLLLVTLTAATENEQLADLVADLGAASAVVRIELEGLGDDEAASLLQRLSDEPLPTGGRQLAHRLRAGTAGNPFFLLEILRHLCETGMFYREARDGRWGSAVPVDDLPLPTGVRDVVLRRVRRLARQTQEVLRVASVLGNEFDLAVVAAMVAGHVPLVDRLDEAVAAHLVAESELVPERYGFRHGLVRRVLYESMSCGRRRDLQLRAGEVLRAQGREATVDGAGGAGGTRDEWLTRGGEGDENAAASCRVEVLEQRVDVLLHRGAGPLESLGVLAGRAQQPQHGQDSAAEQLGPGSSKTAERVPGERSRIPEPRDACPSGADDTPL